MDNDLMFSRNRNDWETPSEIFDPLNEIFQFTVDCAASALNAKCAKFFGEGDDIVLTPQDSAFENPPYSPKKLCKRVVNDLYIEGRVHTVPVVVLIPARTETEIWQDIIFKMDYQFFFRGRITFVGATSPAPFPSALGIMNASDSQLEQLQKVFRGTLK